MTSRRRLDLEALLHGFKATPWTAWTLIVANLAAVWYGYTDYYAGQLSRTPWYWRPLVPDSPNAVLLFAVVLALYQLRVRHRVLDLFAWALNIKVGLWTVFVLTYYMEGFFRGREVIQSVLFVLHLGMVAQAFLLHRDLRRDPPGPRAVAGLAAFFVATDVLDYWLPLRTCGFQTGPGLHPCLPGPSLPEVAFVTLLLSAGVAALAALLYPRSRRKSRAEPRGKTAPQQGI